MCNRKYYDYGIFSLKICVIEILLIGALCLYKSYFISADNERSITVSSTLLSSGEINPYAEEAEAVVSEDYKEIGNYNQSINEGVGNILRENILGNFKTESGAEFSFGKNSYYSGFFDSQNQEVYGYIYSLYEEKGSYYISICDSKKTKMVVYQVVMKNDSRFILYYSKADLKIVIERE